MTPRLVLVALLSLVLGLGVATSATSAAADVTPLPAATDVDYQLGGNAARPDHVGILVRDRTAKPAAGRYNVCYVNGFQSQPGERRFWLQRKHLLLKKDGKPVVDEAWGEFLLDIRTPAKRQRLAAIVGRWTAGCAERGYDAVEYDNLDSFSRSRGLVTRDHATAFARLLVRDAHRVDLAAGQKNMAGFDGTTIGFDFAVSESCARYDECGRYRSSYGDQVLMVEYRRRDFDQACARHGASVPVVLRDLALKPSYRPRYC